MSRKGCLSGIMGVVFWMVCIAGICGMVLLVSGCALADTSTTLSVREEVEDTGLYFISTNYKETIMPERNSVLFTAWNVKKTDFWTKELVPRITDAEEELKNLWLAGYAGYDIIANGGLSYLHTVSTGTAKIVAYYKSIKPKFLYPNIELGLTGAYIDSTHVYLAEFEGSPDEAFSGMVIRIKIDSPTWVYNTIIAYNGITSIATVAVAWPSSWEDLDNSFEVGVPDLIEESDTQVGDSIIIMGLKLGENNLIQSLGFPIQVGIYKEKQTEWRFGNWHLFFTNPNYDDRIPNIYNSIIDLDIGDFYGLFSGGHIEKCILNVYNYLVKTSDTTFIDVRFVLKGTGTLLIANSINVNILRIHFKDFIGVSDQIEFHTTEGYDLVNNHFLFENCNVEFNNVYGFDFEYIYLRNSVITGFGLTGVVFLPAPPSLLTTISNDVLWDELDLTEIMNSANYLYLSAQISMQRKTVKGVYGTISRKYYRVQFMPNVIVYDELKHFDTNDYLVIHRTEEETLLLGKTIKDLTLYDGAAVYSYRNDVSFLMIGKNADGDYSVFAWHKNEIAQTVFGDAPFGVEYEIVWCFQIWEPADDVEIRNYGDWDDSELEGTVVYQDVTSKAVIQ